MMFILCQVTRCGAPQPSPSLLTSLMCGHSPFAILPLPYPPSPVWPRMPQLQRRTVGLQHRQGTHQCVQTHRKLARRVTGVGKAAGRDAGARGGAGRRGDGCTMRPRAQRRAHLVKCSGLSDAEHWSVREASIHCTARPAGPMVICAGRGRAQRVSVPSAWHCAAQRIAASRSMHRYCSAESHNAW